MENLINGTVPVSRRQILSPEGLSVWFVVCGLCSVAWPQGILGVRGQPGGDPGAWSDSSNTFFGSLLIDSSLGFARAGHRMRAGRHSARPPLPKS